MAGIKDIKKDKNPTQQGSGRKMNFAFGKKNYLFLVVGMVLLIIGYITLSGGGSANPNTFSYALFDTRRMVVAPFILFFGYCVIAYAIMVRPKPEGTSGENGQ